ncbi:uncharacterized protein G2W53_023939 [Senna tora]|uniref:Uncharacterized protein n=1 Tax=Senna tora TaxID=362788 RepID=A0A834TBF5_9FABA|nr:uncharacterized protein G2W53_023939 [Senna tora]
MRRKETAFARLRKFRRRKIGVDGLVLSGFASVTKTSRHDYGV